MGFGDHGLLLLCGECKSGAQSPLLLTVHTELLFVEEHLTIVFGPLDCQKHIVLVGGEEPVGRGAHVVGRREGDAAHGE